jgi:ketosteroid isomerase-like protein
MSEETVERTRRAFHAFNRRDLDAFLALIDPEVEFTTRYMEMEGDSYYRGQDGIREWWRDLLAIFPDFSVEVLEVRDLGDSGIAALRVRGHGVDSARCFAHSSASHGPVEQVGHARFVGVRPFHPRVSGRRLAFSRARRADVHRPAIRGHHPLKLGAPSP